MPTTRDDLKEAKKKQFSVDTVQEDTQKTEPLRSSSKLPRFGKYCYVRYDETGKIVQVFRTFPEWMD